MTDIVYLAIFENEKPLRNFNGIVGFIERTFWYTQNQSDNKFDSWQMPEKVVGLQGQHSYTVQFSKSSNYSSVFQLNKRAPLSAFCMSNIHCGFGPSKGALFVF